MKQEVASFLARLRKAGRTYPARSVDNTAQFPSAAIRRLQMGLPSRCRDDGLELSQLPRE